jgi:hypothetical protein
MKYYNKSNLYIFLFFLTAVSIWLFSGSTTVSNPFMKGMTVSCQTWGYEWATPEMKKAMIELKTLGANSISIHPYARISEDGHVRFNKNRQSNHITTPIEWGKELNIQLMIKPHLAYWGTKFRWRGDIDFENEEEWQNFFHDYEQWIVTIAIIAEKSAAPIFCVGTELTNSIEYDKEWRQIISSIREVYSGKLTYAANWDKYDRVSFWDDLDYIGIQAYFPLVENDLPTEDQIISGWDRVYQEIIPFASSLNKQIIFTEIGYDISVSAAREPWNSGNENQQQGEYMQKLCLKVALEKVKEHDQMAGLFLWKWFAETQPFAHHENYNLQRPEIKSLLKEQWAK